MNISNRSIYKIKNLAERFTRNTPILCKKHMTTGLPIDKPSNLDGLESTHPSETFSKIVQNEINIQRHRINTTDEALKYCIEEELRDIFKSEYYQKGDERSCIKCYRQRLEAENGLPIRMVVPDKYDEINTL